MARYSDSASPDEAVLIETDDFALVYDRRNRAFHKKLWNSSTKSWTTKVAPYSALVAKDGSTVWAEDSDGKTIASGEAGVDDASVIQSVIDILPNYKGTGHPYAGIIVFDSQSTYNIKKTISISKKIIFEGEKFVVDAPLGFEVFDGDKTGPNPCCVTFRDLIIDGNGNDVFAFRYCNSWRLINLKIINAKHALLLERTWSVDQLILNCDFRGVPPDGEGLIHILTPDNDSTNSLAIINLACSPYNNNASAIHIEPQANNNPINHLIIKRLHVEAIGYTPKVITGRGVWQGNIEFSASVQTTTTKPLIDLECVHGVSISTYTGVPMKFGWIYRSEIKVRDLYKPERWASRPLIHITNGVSNVIDLREFWRVELSDTTPLIKIGDPGYSPRNILIKNLELGSSKMHSVIRLNDAAKNVKLVNCRFEYLNPDNAYSETYIVYTEGGVCVLEDCEAVATTYYDLANDISKITLRRLRGDWKSENSGTATFSGDGTTTQFSIAHGLVSTPTKVQVTPMSSDAASDFYVTADDTNIYINYKSAPPSGTDNLKFSWFAEV